VGDFQGHPFRGNQWTDSHGSASEPGVSKGDYLAPSAPVSFRSKQFQDDKKLLDRIHMAYAKNPLTPWSDEFSGGSGDAYKPENDLSAQLMDLHARQDAKLKELGIQFAYEPGGGYYDPRKGFGMGMPPLQNPATVTKSGMGDWEVRDGDGNLVGGYGSQERANEVAAGITPRHPIFETDDRSANALASTVLTNQIIAAIEEAPPEVRAMLKDRPLNIRYEAAAPSFERNGETYTEGASVSFTRISSPGRFGTKDTLTLNVYRATSVTPDVIEHEVGHLFVYGVTHGSDQSSKDAVRVMMRDAVIAEGGVTEYADSYQNGINKDKGRHTDPFGVEHRSHEQVAEVEAMYAKTNLKNREGGMQDFDPISFAHALALGKQSNVGGHIRGTVEKPFPKTALAWLIARDTSGPAPKDIRKWAEKDYRKAWEFNRVIALSNGQADPGGFGDGKAATQALRNRWKQQWEMGG
jgi:hypothetical protein